ncbi:MAG TPA: DNA-3-methyladenine glycosylase I [Candidatus Saccharimonadales bacterium]|nr:DNA-3-methyladenine glycosylase I [Candidatus Saccharimonadales bacterium]
MPDWHMHHKVEKPANDNEYLERMSRVIFAAGLNWRVLEKKWPGIVKAYGGFDVAKVAGYLEPDIERLMNDPDVIHNLAKLRAIIANAKEMQAIAADYGSFENYLASVRKEAGEDGLVATLSKRFAFLGKGTTVIFLFAVGQDMPKAAAEWQARHDKMQTT